MKFFDGVYQNVDLSILKLDIEHLSDGFFNEKLKLNSQRLSNSQIAIHNSHGSLRDIYHAAEAIFLFLSG